jgi:predicted outer membrane protein
MRSTRYVTGTGLVVGAPAVTATALVYPVMSGLRAGAAADPSPETVPTQYGPLTALDREFLVKVGLAGLWELPTGQMALQKGTTAAAGTAGEHLIDGQHTGLDASSRRIAPQLGVALPHRPTVQQRGFLSTLSPAQGTEFDGQLANILRLWHGKVLPVIAQVTAATRNSLVRQPADQANTTVLDHMTVLEQMGVVDFDQNAIDTTVSPTVDPDDTLAPSPSPGEPTLVVTHSPTYSLPPAASSPAP